MKFIGLSLTFCIRDIVDGIVDKNDVLAIISNTSISDDDWAAKMIGYNHTWWNDRGLDVVMDFKKKGMILQPRLQSSYNIYLGPDMIHQHWALVIDQHTFTR